MYLNVTKVYKDSVSRKWNHHRQLLKISVALFSYQHNVKPIHFLFSDIYD